MFDEVLGSVERLKFYHRSVMGAMHRELRRFPGGACEIARMLGRTEALFLGQFNPNDIDHTPSLLTFLETIQYMGPGARETVHAIASYANCATFPIPHGMHTAASDAEAVELLCAAIKRVTKDIEGRSDNLDAKRRATSRQHLLALIATAHDLLSRARA